MTSSIWWIGTLGIVAIEASYLPQIFRLQRLKRAEDISLFFPSLNLAGRILALTYSMMSSEQVFTIGFFIGALLRLTLLIQVAWYRHTASEKKHPAPAHAVLRGEMAR
jgi:uncharacterized protein with PQ loop repeat